MNRATSIVIASVLVIIGFALLLAVIAVMISLMQTRPWAIVVFLLAGFAAAFAPVVLELAEAITGWRK